MMIAVKIECGCGQHYAFDVEADGDLQPGTVVCPTCGIDGTNAANAVIAQKLAAEPAVAAGPVVKERIHIITPPARAVSPPPPPLSKARPGAVAYGTQDSDHIQAELEAKAKILWGEPPEEVIKFLMIRGFSYQEASDKVRVLFKERIAAIRANGIGKMLIGIFVAFGSAALLLVLWKAGMISIWLFGSVAIGGVYGLWMILKGLLKVLAPKSERGDASEND